MPIQYTPKENTSREGFKAKGPRYERETVIVFNEEDQTASVWTASEVTYRRMIKVGYLPTEQGDRSATFKVSKREIRLPKPKKTVTNPQREVLDRARRASFGQKAPVAAGSGEGNGVGKGLGCGPTLSATASG